MSVKDAKEFLAKTGIDSGLAQKVREAGTNVEEIIRLGKENGCDFTAEDLKAVRDETEQLVGAGLLTFLEKAATDEELAGKMEAVGTDLDAVIKLGKENGCEFTADNLTALQNMMMQSDVELSDDDLEQVAGGLATVIGFFLGMMALAAGGAAAMAVGIGAGYGLAAATASKK